MSVVNHHLTYTSHVSGNLTAELSWDLRLKSDDALVGSLDHRS